MRLWYVSEERPGVGWFHDMDFAKDLREEIASADEPGSERRSWGAFEASFFGPPFQAVESLSRNYDERFLDAQLTRGTPPDFSDPEDAAHSTGEKRGPTLVESSAGRTDATLSGMDPLLYDWETRSGSL